MLTPLPVIVSVLATLAIGYVVYKTLVPVPAGPYITSRPSDGSSELVVELGQLLRHCITLVAP